jgi:hypothetical protein
MRQRGTRRVQLTVATPHAGASRLTVKVARTRLLLRLLVRCAISFVRGHRTNARAGHRAGADDVCTVSGPPGGRDLLGSASLGEPKLFSLSGQRLHSEGQRGHRRWFPQKTRHAAVRQNGDSVSRALSGFYRKGSDMTHVRCPDCRLRFTAAAAAYLDGPPQKANVAAAQARRRHPRPGRAAQ